MNFKLTKDNIVEILPLSRMQESMLFQYLTKENSAEYMEELFVTLQGNLVKDNFIKACQVVIENNEVLRTVFSWKKTQNPIQIVLKKVELPIQFYDLDEKNGEVKRDEIVEEEHKKGIDLAEMPFRINVCKYSEHKSEIIFIYHHILFDGWSTGVLLKEIIEAYDAVTEERMPVFQRKTKYKEYLRYLKMHPFEKEKGYWSRTLKDYEIKDFVRKDFTSVAEDYANNSGKWQIGSTALECSDEFLKRLETYIRNKGITKAAFLYTAWAILLSKHSDSNDVMFGTTVAGRNLDISFENTIGLFINTVPVRLQLDQEESVDMLLQKMEQYLGGRMENETLSFDEIRQCVSGENQNILDTLVVVENYPVDRSLKDKHYLNIERYEMKEETNFPLVLEVLMLENIQISIHYKKQYYTEERMRQLTRHLFCIMEQMLEDDSSTILDLEIMTEKERQRMIEQWNGNDVEYPDTVTVVSFFYNTVKKQGESEAVYYGDRSMTYKELNSKSNMLARMLQKKGIKKDTLVGIQMERSFEMVVAIWAILKAGGAYVPIAPDYPEDRIEYIIANSKIQVILTQKELCLLYKSEEIEYLEIESEANYDADDSDLTYQPNPDDLAYVIYTSGSTGNPKGVMIEHHSLVNRLVWMQKRYPLNSTDTILQKTTYTFDVSVWELIWWGMYGAKVCMLEAGDEKFPNKIIETIAKRKVTTMHFVPSMLQVFLDYIKMHPDVTPLAELRQVFASGEALTANQVKMFYESLYMENGTRLINLYGPTEASIDVSYYECFEHGKLGNSVPIGKPIDNTKLFVVNQYGQLMPEGIPGELCIAGVGLARGYVNNQALTDEKFVECSFMPEVRMYKTGDLAWWNYKGQIEYIGRKDFQVKLRGLRIELGEIETALTQQDKVKEAVVLVLSRKNGDQYLCAYFVTQGNIELDVEEIKACLHKKLPEYMIPSYYVRLDELPITRNGKLDRKSLPDPLQTKGQNPIHKADTKLSKTEQIVADAWKEILETDNVETDKSFFESGGNSVLMLRLHGILEKAFPNKIKMTHLFEYPSIQEFAKFLDGKEEQKVDVEETAVHQNSDIAIIGISAKLGGTSSLQQLKENMEREMCLVRPLSRTRKEDVRNYMNTCLNGMDEPEYVQGAYFDEIDKFDHEFFEISPNEANLWDPAQRIFLECAWEAIEDAGYAENKIRGTKTGVFAGVSSSDIYDYKQLIMNADLEKEVFAQSVTGNLKPMIASRISYLLDLKGNNLILDTACSSSLIALHLACQSIQNGESKMAIAGGIKINLLPVKRQYKMGIEASTGRTRAFDYSSDGTGDGEGCVVLLLKPVEAAVKDRDHIYAVIKATAANQDGQSAGITAPNMIAQQELIMQTWKKAGIDPSSISYIEAHGTGTKLGDPIEIEGITKAFSKYTNRKQFCAVSSVKTNIGHLDAVAGLAGVAKAIVSLKNRKLYPNLFFERPNSNIEFEQSSIYVVDQLMDWKVEEGALRCGVSSFGLSGTNGHVVLEEAPVQHRTDQAREENQPYLFTLSAKDRESLNEYLFKFMKALHGTLKQEYIGDICYTANTGRKVHSCRVAIVTTSVSDLAHKMASLIGADSDTVDKSAVFVSGCDWITHEEAGEKNPLQAMAIQFVQGKTLDWENIYKEEKRYRLSLPTYPFKRIRHWIESSQEPVKLVKEQWELHEFMPCNVRKPGSVLCITAQKDDGVYQELLKKHDNAVQINRKEASGISIDGYGKYQTILWVSDAEGKEAWNLQEQTEELRNMHEHVKKLMASEWKGNIYVVTRQAYAVSKKEKTIQFNRAFLTGYLKTFCAEMPSLRCRIIDYAEQSDIPFVIEEMYREETQFQIAYRNGKRYGKVLCMAQADAFAKTGCDIKSDGVYLITGGAGGIGSAVTRKLVDENRNCKIVLLGRRGEDEQIHNELAVSGQVAYRQCDVSDKEAVDLVLQELKQQYGRINGIVHCAGVSGKGFIKDKEWEEILAVLAPKAMGLLNIYDNLKNDGWDFFVTCSSVTTIAGIPGQSDYTAANAFMEAFSEYSRLDGYLVKTISWAPWREAGMAYEYGINENNIFKPLSTEEGIDLFYRILHWDVERIICGEFNPEGNVNGVSATYILDSLGMKLSEQLTAQMKPAKKKEKKIHMLYNEAKVDGIEDVENQDVCNKIASIWSRVLGYDSFRKDSNFFDIGGDSISVLQVHAMCEETFHCKLNIGDFFSYPTIENLTSYISSIIGQKEESQELKQIISLATSVREQKMSPEEAVAMFMDGAEWELLV